jgi:hypothetical protein
MIVKTFGMTKEIRSSRAKSLRDTKSLRDHRQFRRNSGERKLSVVPLRAPVRGAACQDGRRVTGRRVTGRRSAPATVPGGKTGRPQRRHHAPSTITLANR